MKKWDLKSGNEFKEAGIMHYKMTCNLTKLFFILV